MLDVRVRVVHRRPSLPLKYEPTTAVSRTVDDRLETSQVQTGIEDRFKPVSVPGTPDPVVSVRYLTTNFKILALWDRIDRNGPADRDSRE